MAAEELADIYIALDEPKNALRYIQWVISIYETWEETDKVNELQQKLQALERNI